jgi:hypothetical protein
VAELDVHADLFAYTAADDPLFSPPGMAEIRPVQILPAFFVGKLSATRHAFAGRSAISSFGELLEARFQQGSITGGESARDLRISCFSTGDSCSKNIACVQRAQSGNSMTTASADVRLPITATDHLCVFVAWCFLGLGCIMIVGIIVASSSRREERVSLHPL